MLTTTLIPKPEIQVALCEEEEGKVEGANEEILAENRCSDPDALQRLVPSPPATMLYGIARTLGMEDSSWTFRDFLRALLFVSPSVCLSFLASIGISSPLHIFGLTSDITVSIIVGCQWYILRRCSGVRAIVRTLRFRFLQVQQGIQWCFGLMLVSYFATLLVAVRQSSLADVAFNLSSHKAQSQFDSQQNKGLLFKWILQLVAFAAEFCWVGVEVASLGCTALFCYVGFSVRAQETEALERFLIDPESKDILALVQAHRPITQTLSWFLTVNVFEFVLYVISFVAGALECDLNDVQSNRAYMQPDGKTFQCSWIQTYYVLFHFLVVVSLVATGIAVSESQLSIADAVSLKQAEIADLRLSTLLTHLDTLRTRQSLGLQLFGLVLTRQLLGKVLYACGTLAYVIYQFPALILW
ncbi:hypothetical protein CYMTET_16097 [Cymbomonas tetramitiformis]|uniref:Uncharacterized protein n=1 Tax=Cymbomonas tetramitiformis TaxID=36881 RepID=A0AAE0L898_9CHLO|nr:hypothetical protein CYMTET_16097 [Cymbomonas tetramitiformis]|eukprot:gene605-1032_t